MPESVTVNLAMPVKSVGAAEEGEDSSASAGAGAANPAAVQAERTGLIRAGQALQDAAVKLQQFQEEIFSSHKEQIVRLSVEIAGKILQKELADGNYEVEKIIQQALKEAPSRDGIVVRLNSDDLERYEKAIKDKGTEVPASVKLVPDEGIGPGQCVVETDKGMIEYFIQEHLKKISEALKITE